MKHDDSVHDAELATALRSVTDDINAKLPAPRAPREVERFVSLGQQCADATVESWRNVLTIAENRLKEAEAFAQSLRHKVEVEARAHADLLAAIQRLGEQTIEIHREFHAAGEGQDGLARLVNAPESRANGK